MELYLETFYFATVLIVTKPLLVELVTTWRGQDDAAVPSKVRFFAQTWYAAYTVMTPGTPLTRLSTFQCRFGSPDRSHLHQYGASRLYMPTVMAHNVGHSGIHKALPYYANSFGLTITQNAQSLRFPDTRLELVCKAL